MSSNQQRRDAAKRKLQRQNERRSEHAQAMRQKLVIVGVVAAVAIIAGAVYLFSGAGSPAKNDATRAAAASGQATTSAGADSFDTSTAGTPASGAPGTVPAANSTAKLAGTCTYSADGTAAKPVTPPTNLDPPTSGDTAATITLNSGDVGVELNRAAAPCTVNSFVSLAQQHYFDGTTCHRLTSSPSLSVLQCGDPTGTGSGGPGYSFPDELSGSETYGAGTLAMANSGPNTNGSQFFIVYADSQLPPSYTVFGKVTAGLDVVKAIAAKGTTTGGQDGAPKDPVTIETVTIAE